jgi:dynein heavy chain
MEKEEIDKKTVLRTNWKKLLKQCEARTEELSRAQTRFKRALLKDIKDFKIDVENFRDDFLRNGSWHSIYFPFTLFQCPFTIYDTLFFVL